MWVYALTPFLTAAIGWLTNWVAVKMLFLPRRPRNILGLKIQGLIPRRQKDLARETAEIIERELLGQHLIRETVKSVPIGDLVEERIRVLIREKLVGRLAALPMIGQFINENTIGSIEGYVVQEVRKMSEEVALEFADQVEARLQVKHLVQEKIEGFDLEKLQEIVESVAAKEFRLIEWTGAILGFTVGAFQSALMAIFAH